MPEWIVGVAASTWGVVMALAPVLQIVRMLRRRSADDISLGYFGLLVPGFLLWVAYGAVAGDAFIAVPNLIATITAVAVIALAIRMRRTSARAQT
ncbi:hypothetical protein F6B41_14540 [Microbacterium lushaniae]|nr:hypothetical protein F6B41_14540 [Microbacterium lushaniae]